MCKLVRSATRIGTLIVFHALLFSVARAETRLEISYDKTIALAPLTGRIILVIARSDRPEPRFQIGPNATPVFGADIERLQPGQPAIIDRATFGHPVESLTKLPAGDYYVPESRN